MIRRSLIPLLVLGIAACGDDGLSLEEIVGTYTLQTIDGEAIPWVKFQTGTTYTLEVTGGNVILNELRTCTNTIMFRETLDGTVTTETETVVCQYSFTDGTLIMTFPVAGTGLNASIVGSLLSYTDGGNLYIFSK